MRHTAIRLSDSYALPESYREQLAKADQIFGHSQPSPDELGGYFDFADWRGNPVGKANFLGRWTLLYFGYSRCQGTCRIAAPLIAKTARSLRARGFSAQAAFVDIESAPVSLPMRVKGEFAHGHGSNWPKRFAMSHLAISHGEDLRVLTGSRLQLSQATAAYHILREHVPPRPSEEGISINHSSTVYLIGPDTLVAGYGYHDMGAETIIGMVEQLSRAERKAIDLAQVRQRFIKGACGVA